MSSKHRYLRLPSRDWAKALIEALESGRSNVRAFEGTEGFDETDLNLAVFRVHENFYVVRARNDFVTAVTWSAFIQAYKTVSRFGYNELTGGVPKGARKVFPLKRKDGGRWREAI